MDVIHLTTAYVGDGIAFSSLNDKFYIIDQDVDLSGVTTHAGSDPNNLELRLGSNCVLSFQGGRFVSNAVITIKGNYTAIEAESFEIFDSNIAISGTWNVSQVHPEWFPNENGDDLHRLNKVTKFLTEGGEIQLLGKYYVSGTFIVPKYIRLVGTGYLRSYIIAKEAFTVSTDEDSNAVVLFKKINTSSSHGIGGRNFSIDCSGKACHGLIMQQPYDDVLFENIMIINVAKSHNAFRILNSGGSVGQTILLLNCYGKQKDRFSSTSDDLSKSESVFYFRGIHETSLIGCKAFGSYAGGMNNIELKNHIKSYLGTPINNNPDCAYIDMPNVLGGSCFCFEDCRGITMQGCSSSMALTSIEINAESKACTGFMISGQTDEWVYVYNLYTYGNLSGNEHSSRYNSVNYVTYLPVRRQNGASSIMLRYCSESFIIYPYSSPITLLNGSSNIIHSVIPVNSYIPESEPGSDPNDIPVVEPELPTSNTNILIPAKLAKVSNGLRVANRMFVMAESDNTHTDEHANNKRSLSLEVEDAVGSICHNANELVRFEDNSVKLIASNEYLKFSAPADSQETGMSIVRHGAGNTLMTYPVVMQSGTLTGYQQLAVQTGNAVVVPTSGTISQLPTSGINAGFCYFATDLHKPLWWDGSNWRDASGSLIS